MPAFYTTFLHHPRTTEIRRLEVWGQVMQNRTILHHSKREPKQAVPIALGPAPDQHGMALPWQFAFDCFRK